jgi:tetratricopeptide (TPR) repeat protein
MATYKKKGQKKVKNTPIEKVEDQSTTAEVFNTLDETASKSEEWIEKNQKPLFYSLVVIALVIMGYLTYNNYVAAPKEREAANELAFPKENFDKAINASAEADSIFSLSLEGTNGKYGLVDIANKYAGTNAGNLANYYAGIAYLEQKNYKNAIAYLEKFNSDDALLKAISLGAIGDAFADLDQEEDALDYYEKAINTNTNRATTPLYLFKAGNTALSIGQADKALSFFSRIKDEFSASDLAKNIELSINKAKYSK